MHYRVAGVVMTLGYRRFVGEGGTRRRGEGGLGGEQEEVGGAR